MMTKDIQERFWNRFVACMPVNARTVVVPSFIQGSEDFDIGNIGGSPWMDSSLMK